MKSRPEDSADINITLFEDEDEVSDIIDKIKKLSLTIRSSARYLDTSDHEES